jgi:ADP-heptose:LPS heptosyltransferase
MSPNKSAVLFMPNWLGDALFATPAIRAVKKSVPGLKLACVAATRVAPVLANNPHIDELFIYDEEPLVGSARSMGLTAELKKHRFDSAVFFHNSRTKSVISRLAGIADRIGPVSSKKTFLTRTVGMPPALLHRIDYYLKLVEPLGAKPHGRTMDFYPRAEAAGRLRAILAAKGVGEGEPYAVVHAGGNWELKRWPIEHFKEWSRLFAARFPWKIVVCGTGDEKKTRGRALRGRSAAYRIRLRRDVFG